VLSRSVDLTMHACTTSEFHSSFEIFSLKFMVGFEIFLSFIARNFIDFLFSDNFKYCKICKSVKISFTVSDHLLV
jgi:hypothetical protein